MNRGELSKSSFCEGELSKSSFREGELSAAVLTVTHVFNISIDLFYLHLF